MMEFLGRREELKQLITLKKKNSASFVVLTGRRRIGKSRLAEEFGQNYKFYSFSGIPPTNSHSSAISRKNFALQLEKYFYTPINYDNWYTMLIYLANQTIKEDSVILLDEIQWIAWKDQEFLSILKTVWDQYFKKNQKLVLIVCGSVSNWIEKNILSSTGFFGRVSLTIQLNELDLLECNIFWQNQQLISAYEKLQILAVTGGVPRYLEEIIASATAQENINNLAFNKNGMLFNEFDLIFHDLFGKRGDIYIKILSAITDQRLTREELGENIGLPTNGVFTEYLEDLEKAGFIEREYKWHLKTGLNQLKYSTYRIKDNYTRFYLKYIRANKRKISAARFKKSLISLNHYTQLIGLQFENLVLNNRHLIIKKLKINPAEIVNDGPYLIKGKKANKGCQIDYLIETKFNSLYLCEIKFSHEKINSKVITEVQEKIDCLQAVKNFSIRPVLIHACGVTQSVIENDYFAGIIDMSQFLQN